MVKDQGPQILEHLLDLYDNADNVHFVGEYLRLFTQYPTLLSCWLKIRLIRKLLNSVLNTDFVIQGDAIETVQNLLIPERPQNLEFCKFID